MRASDVLRLKWSDFKDDRLHYTMGKNNKPGSLKIHEKVFAILDNYRADKKNEHDFVFAELKQLDNPDDKFAEQRKIAFSISRLDGFLKDFVAPAAKITSSLSMHIARHTFGNIAGNTIPLTMVQKIFRHSNILTTMGYMNNFIHKDADDALDTVLGK